MSGYIQYKFYVIWDLLSMDEKIKFDNFVELAVNSAA